MDINHRLQDVEQSSTVYVHQAEKFHAEATHVNSPLIIIYTKLSSYSYHLC